MSKSRIRITLLSDLCVSDGGVYNSALDTDVCYDEYGFPYIPAKRLKGCLRESALELEDWGRHISIDELFGEKGNQRGVARISNAYLADYEEAKTELLQLPAHVIYHPQHILQRYTYVRTQTAVDYEQGVADDTSLRTMRVVKRGNVFYADIEWDDSLSEDREKALFEELNLCCKVLRYMGIARTRGLGEIQCRLECVPDGNTGDGGESGEKETEGCGKTEESVIQAPWNPDANKLWYSIFLNEPVIMKSTNGGESRSLDYIEGSTILGIIANRLKKRGNMQLVTLLDQGEIQFSNAYLEAAAGSGENRIRLTEVPGNYYEIKNDNVRYVDKLYADGHEDETKGEQLNSMKHTYIGFDHGMLMKKDVEIESRYHHRRSADKSIGRAHDEPSGDSTFYQMSSIMAGQSFQGYIYGTPEQIAFIYKVLTEDTVAHIGYSRNAEYGRVTIQCIKTEKVKAPGEESQGSGTQEADISRFFVKLEAPTIIYSDKAMYTTEPKVLAEEIAEALGISWESIDEEKITYYLKYTDIGGYNVTWGRRKPVLTAFDKGTVVDISLKQKMKVMPPEQIMLGERVTEGYGEASFYIADEDGTYVNSFAAAKTEAGNDRPVLKLSGKEILAKAVCDDLFDLFIKMYAVKMVEKNKDNITESMKSTISNMLLMCDECETVQEVSESVDKRYDKNLEKKKDKGEYARFILHEVESNSVPCVQEFEKKYDIQGYANLEQRIEDIQFKLLKAYLISLKYQLREGDREDEQ